MEEEGKKERYILYINTTFSPWTRMMDTKCGIQTRRNFPVIAKKICVSMYFSNPRSV